MTAKTTPERLPLLVLEVEKNAEGNVLAYLGKEDDGCCYRIAGPKAWGGSRNIATLKIRAADMITFINEFMPELIPHLKVK